MAILKAAPQPGTYCCHPGAFNAFAQPDEMDDAPPQPVGKVSGCALRECSDPAGVNVRAFPIKSTFRSRSGTLPQAVGCPGLAFRRGTEDTLSCFQAEYT